MSDYLSTLTDAQLEEIYNAASLSCDADLSDAVLLEILKNRPDFCPGDNYELMWELQDWGWHGGVTQEDRDAR